MKRPPGIWLLLSAGVLWLSVQNVYGLKATELIFGRTTSTTTTTEAPHEGEQKEGVTESIVENENTTKSNLTGNPQLDYIYDPNLPRELNGYNLSSYPFYNSMPEDIDFKCDGLHDGFYASVPHKCQVYHHCLFGTRYDFLCANYTAFDQKTFICHFVSEVDCNNSHKYWHRNDALYQAASTTTQKPTPVVISPALNPANRRPFNTNRRRKNPRRRPQYEYYDDEYDDAEEEYEEPPPRRRRKRPRPRRPIYEDDYEYEEDRYERRGSSRHKEDEDRRRDEDHRDNDRRRDEDRRRESDDRRDSEDRRESSRDKTERKENRSRDDEDGRHKSEDKHYDTRKRDDDDRKYDRRDYDDRRYDDRRHDDRRYEDDRYDRRRDEDRKRRPDDDYEDDRDFRRDKRPDRRYEKRRKEDRPRNSHRRPYDDDYEDERDDDRRPYRPRKSERDEPQETDGASLVKPNSSSSVFNQPRMPPKIRPPVPKNEQNKFAYKPTEKSKSVDDEEEYEEYEDEPPKKTTPRPTRKPDPDSIERRSTRKPDLDAGERRPPTRKPEPDLGERPTRKPDPDYNERRTSRKPDPDSSERRTKPSERRPLGSASRTRVISRRPVEEHYEEESRPRPSRPRHDDRSETKRFKEDDRSSKESRRPISQEDKEITTEKPKPKERTNTFVAKFLAKEPRTRLTERRPEITSTTTTTTTTTTREPPRHRSEPIVKVVKRPFLPSRGGNPYSARGLQPVGAKALVPKPQEPEPKPDYDEPPLKPRFQVPKGIVEEYDDEDDPIDDVQNGRQFPTSTTSKPFLINEQPAEEKDPPKEVKQPDPPQEKPFKASPLLVKVPIRLKYTGVRQDDDEDFRPVSNRPLFRQNKNFQEQPTEKPNPPERNPLDITENEYDVTLNDALNPTIPNLPVRSFPTGYDAATDYSFSTFHRPRYEVLNQASENRYQVRSPSQRVETVVQPYFQGGKKYVNENPQYNLGPGQIYQNPNFRSSPHITQAQTHAFYNVY